MSGDYITGTAHAATLSSAMNDFHEALTFRWRELVVQRIQAVEDFPTRVRRSVSAANHVPLWDHLSAPAVHHLRGAGGGCAYVAWVEGGQEGSLGGVTCDGKTGVTDEEGVEVMGPNGRMETVPPFIECGMGQILGEVENWAWGEREYTYYELPLFDTQDMGAINDAYDTFIAVGGQLGLEAGSGSGSDVGSFTPVSERELVGKAEDLSGARAQGQDWWAGWTGLAASRAKAGFFDSVTPTTNNQSGMVGCLANLYAARGAIIEKGRNDSLYWIQWATKSLKETQAISTDLVAGWKVMQGIGSAIAISGGWTVAGGAIGASIALVGFCGENLLPSVKTEGYAHDLVAVVEKLNTKVTELNTELDTMETEYTGEVNNLQSTVFGIHSFNLELYDLTQNNPGGDDHGADDYTANVENILKIGQTCYEAGEFYDGLWPRIAQTSDADAHLTDKDGAATAGDTALLELRTMFEGFVKTACGRYLVAGDQTVAAAEDYAQVESDQQGAYERIMDDWEEAGVGDHDSSLNPGQEADATDRGDYDPYADHPALGGADPGAATGDGEDYETDADSPN